MRKSRFKRSFRKERKLLKKRGWKISKLDAVIERLVKELPVPSHPLHGNWEGKLDSHVEGDWILIYEINDDAEEKTVTFHRTGTHSDLFRKS